MIEHERCQPSRGNVVAATLAGLVLLLLGAGAHLAYLLLDCPIDLSGDEAHYWEWARRLDLSYYSKGPLVAYIIAAGRYFLAPLSEQLLGNEELAVRGPAVLLSVLTGLGLYVLTVQTLRRPWLGVAVVGLSMTVPILAAGAMLMTIDAPLAALWVWALVCVCRALTRDRLRWWLAAGTLIAVGLLAKYTIALIFPAVGLLLLTDPAARRQLRRAGPYLATLLGFTGLIPILAWNAQHDWVSFRHVAGQAGVSGGLHVDPGGIVRYLGGQWAVVGLVWFPALWCALAQRWRTPVAETEPHDRTAINLLIWTAVTPWLVFLAFSPITKIQPNWPVLGLPSALILLALWLARGWRAAHQATRRRYQLLTAGGIAAGLGLVLVAHGSHQLVPIYAWLARGAPPLGLTTKAPPWNLTPIRQYDPAARLRGWAVLGQAVGDVLAAERRAGRDPFIMTDDYQVASEIAFYCPGEPVVYSVQSVLGDRLSQYDLWTNPIDDPAAFVGRPCIYVGTLRPPLTAADHAPAALQDVARVTTVEYFLGSQPVQIWPVFRARSFAGFPADIRAQQARF
jgi:4-amino-4-deoxy-L-arabinose transferase-like glycosyltransferase